MKLMNTFKYIAVGTLAIGINTSSFAQRTISSDAKLKFDDVLELVNNRYVDTVNQNQLIEDAIRGMMKDLDPHSEFYTAEEYKKMNEPLKETLRGLAFSLIY